MKKWMWVGAMTVVENSPRCARVSKCCLFVLGRYWENVLNQNLEPLESDSDSRGQFTTHPAGSRVSPSRMKIGSSDHSPTSQSYSLSFMPSASIGPFDI